MKTPDTQVTIGLGTICFVILFVLKVSGQTDMGWFLVLTSWIWVPIAILLASALAMFMFAVVVVTLAAIFGKV